MAESSQTVNSAWPAPPPFYTYYTDANIALLERRRIATNEGREPPPIPARLGFDLDELEPPEPIKEGTYWIFNQPWQTQDKLPTLKEMGVEQLFPDGPIDRVKELKKLNHSLILNFLELFDVLINAPVEYTHKVNHINIILMNMHFVLNEYRPHQARETLRMMMENQLMRKQRATEELKKTCNEISKTLEGLRVDLQMVIDKSDDSLIGNLREETNTAKDGFNAEKRNSIGNLESRLLQLADIIE